MAPPAADGAAAPTPRLAALLAPTPGRLAFALRLALVAALVTLVTELYRTPLPWLTIYIVFFIMKPDRTTTVVLGAVMTVLVTVIIGVLFLIAAQVIDDPMKRVIAMAVLSFGLLFLGSASKLKPVASVIALVMVFALDELGAVPAAEVATRALLYAWLFVATPAGAAIIVSAAFGASPRRLAERALAERLRLAAAMLGAPDTRTREAFAEALSEGPGEVPAWLRAAAIERSSSAADLAALEQASRSTAVLLELVDLADRTPEARWPDAIRARLGSKLSSMAIILERGGYPLDVDPGDEDDPGMTPLAARSLAQTRAALARFAEKPSAPARGSETAKRDNAGFFSDDAFTNPAHIYYALKTTGAALFCYFVYSMIDWPGIHTCLITCYIVALETTAETIEKITLRIVGCLIGAAAGVATILFVMPHVESIGALMAIVFAGSLASAWIAAGGPRISYLGFQVALAFYICVAQGWSPSFDMTSIRDRIVGILFGELVIAAVFTSVRPVSIAARVDRALPALLRRLAALAAAAGPAERSPLVAQTQTDLDATAQDLAIARYEPRAILPPPAWFARRREMVRDLASLPAPMLLLPGPDEGICLRIERVAAALSGRPAVPANDSSSASAGFGDLAPSLRALIDRPLAALERIAAEESADETEGPAHAPA